MQSFTVCFLLPLIFTVHAEVVQSFKNKCDQFFYKGSEPQLDNSRRNYRRICQTFENKPYFATLYDTANRIPVYSAYIYEKDASACHWETHWFIEPQLVDQNWNKLKSMMTAGDLEHTDEYTKSIKKGMGDEQALDTDYTGLMHHNRGHLNPNQHHSDPDCRATYTLTNIVPQNIELNGGYWNTYETSLRNIIGDCKTAYVLVGAIPSKDKWVKDNNDRNRVNIPDYLWHAYCCVENDGNLKTGAAAVKNENEQVTTCSLDSLKKFFTKVESRIQIPFLDDCTAKGKTTTTVGGHCESIVPKPKPE